MRHSEREATVRVGIVNVFVVESQWNMLAPAANPTRLDLLQPRSYIEGVLSHRQESLVVKSLSALPCMEHRLWGQQLPRR